MRAEIDSVIALQEDIGPEVLVHGEPERMSVDWKTYARSRTRKPVKGMLTGQRCCTWDRGFATGLLWLGRS
jgi:5-methyltetrahydropteroyltriglutamate--homocysteine methyltransferase